jgi:dolichyl-phosphate beta-glucosyltransferase
MKYSIMIVSAAGSLNLESQVAEFIGQLPKKITDVLAEIVLVVDEGSREVVEACRRSERCFPSLVKVFAGRGPQALQHSIERCTGTYLCILGAESLSIEFVLRSIRFFEAKGIDLIVGSRRHPDSVDERPIVHRILTMLYNFVFLDCVIGYPGTESRGLKSIRTTCAKQLCETALTTGNSFDTEIVLLAWRLGYRIGEVPVTIGSRAFSSAHFSHRVPQLVRSAFEIRRSLRRFPSGNFSGGHQAPIIDGNA